MPETLSIPIEKKAYQFSKWTKKLLLDSVQEYAAKKDMVILLDALVALKKRPANCLKSFLLKKSKQAHISASGNKTPLYTLNLRAIATLNMAHSPKCKKVSHPKEATTCASAFAAECSRVSNSPRVYITAALHLLLQGSFTVSQIIDVYHKHVAEKKPSVSRVEQYFKQLEDSKEFFQCRKEFQSI